MPPIAAQKPIGLATTQCLRHLCHFFGLSLRHVGDLAGLDEMLHGAVRNITEPPGLPGTGRLTQALLLPVAMGSGTGLY